MSESLVTYTVEDGLGRLTLNRPSAMNAVNPDLIVDLLAAARAVGPSGAKALLITGEGRSFCVGADIKHFADKLDRLPAELGSMADGFHAALVELDRLPIPIIAAVQGHAIGAGFGLALIADIVISDSIASFSTGYIRLGLSSDAGVSWALTRALGLRRARSLLMTARTISAAEALQWGLIDEVVDPAEHMSRAVTEGFKLAKGPQAAYSEVKRLTAEARDVSLADHLDRERASILLLADNPSVPCAIATRLDR